ncbi:MAG: molybdopterin molybdotransferase MoeA [Akkermansiaceae bacterium]|jgi:molybdopterin molybdotransferase|nr:molybdopterin molybdotransferase MoeA [Akkermansiaceae bacterium]
MIPFAKARDLLLEHTRVTGSERIRIEHAAGRVLRQELRADRDYPPFDRVMMDGYAVRAADFARGRSFRVTGCAPAGLAVVCLTDMPGTCVEVMTGAPCPSGADCIVPVEEVTRVGDEIAIAHGFAPVAGRFIHRAGADARQGEILLTSGTRLGGREIGVAASCGAGWLEVARIPDIAVLATGDELVPVDTRPAAHQIRQSNAHALTCALQLAGFPPSRADAISDAPEERQRVAGLLNECDWLLITGAVSKGARDFIPGLLAALGCAKLFHGVAQRPGKPAGCWLGPGEQLVMALPGNPVSALTGLHALVLPALAAAVGQPPPASRIVTPAEPLAGLEGLTHHLPVVLDAGGRARPAPPGNSGDFIGLLRSDGFVTLPPGPGPFAAVPFTPWL